jgi:hypothetical protein
VKLIASTSKIDVMKVENCMKRTIARNGFPELKATQNEFFSSWVEALAPYLPLHLARRHT